MTQEITEDDKIYKMGIDPYEEDVPGKDGKEFQLTLAEKWLSKPPKEMQILFGAESGKKFMEAFEETILNQNPWLKKEKEKFYNSINKLPSCGQRYERENNEEEEEEN